MKKLITLKLNDNQQAVNARDMYLELGLTSKQWKRWSTRNIVENEYFKNGIDWIEAGNIMLPGKEVINYALTIDFAKHLCMMAKTDKAHDVRNYFLKCEEELKAQQEPKQELSTIEVLKLATDHIAKLETELAITTARKNEVTNVLDAIQTYGDNILFRDFVKIVYQEKGIQITEKEFRNLLKKEQYIMSDNMPYARYIKYFNVNRGVKNGKAWSTTRLSAKGQLYFANKLVKMFDE